MIPIDLSDKTILLTGALGGIAAEGVVRNQPTDKPGNTTHDYS